MKRIPHDLRRAAVLAATSLAFVSPPSFAQERSPAPGPRVTETRVTETLVAADHVWCLLRTDGSVRCWGPNDFGQLGRGDRRELGFDEPAFHTASPNTAFSARAVIARTRPVDFGVGRSARAVAVGGTHACALLDDATVRCWGRNDAGQLGYGDRRDRGRARSDMGNALAPVDLGVGHTALAIAAGAHHTCALLDDHSVRCWGYNYSGQLGLGDHETRGDDASEMGSALRPVDLGAGHTALAIAASGLSTCAIRDDHRVVCWGANDTGQLGQGHRNAIGDEAGEMGARLIPVDLGRGRSAEAIAMSAHTTCAVRDDRSVVCWGANTDGQLGREGRALQLPGDVVAMAPDTFGVCGLGTDGDVRCWGPGLHSSGVRRREPVGDDPNEMGDALVPIALGPGRTAISVVALDRMTIVIGDDHRARCWGDGRPPEPTSNPGDSF